MGAFEIGFEGAEMIPWRSKKCTNLFAFLLINHGRLVSRPRLEQLLWPEPERPAGPTALKVLVHSLRRALDAAFGAERDFLRIGSGEGGYRLELGERVRADIHEFERLCRAASEASRHGAVDAALDCYSRAVDLYQGDFMDGRGEEWVLEQREWLRAKMMHALGRLLRHANDVDDAVTAIQHARRMLELDPTEERAFQAMILVHGRRAELDQVNYWYELCVGRLARELDASPQEETRRLLHRARNGDLSEPRGIGRSRRPRRRRRASTAVDEQCTAI
ncbi:BTAD domain-containing putative transcriptional regulator [Nocardia sp. NPDC050712]|uniref:AfsR/SARP family transcriptional regulator n=1 Tax=Nocardia sp. NPDC050712 TaxID=3155518 RepID=UPI0034003EB1